MPDIVHSPIPEDLTLKHTAHEERHLLENVQIPVVTVSATFRDELETKFGEKPLADTPEVTFSRAHYSMANALVVAATQTKKTVWLIDPTNYVSSKDWPKILFTEAMGKLIARNPLLKEIKDMVDTRVRNQLPLTKAIKDPLIYVFGRVKRPIISFHYEAGNVLLENHKQVLQIVTDPHVRPQYVLHAKNPNLTWCVFDDKTKASLLETAYLETGTLVDESRVTITGCPVDPRIPLKDRNHATQGFKRRPLRLAITTGGLGTNKDEIERLLLNLTPLLRKKEVQLIAYAGVHDDFAAMFHKYAEFNRLSVAPLDHSEATLRIFHGEGIVEANELLLKYIFPWADGIITKPSGDMAYEAITAGCFLLTLKPWGVWEENIQSYFEERGVSVRANPDKICEQLFALTHLPIEAHMPWAEAALLRAQKLVPHLALGASNILKAYAKL